MLERFVNKKQIEQNKYLQEFFTIIRKFLSLLFKCKDFKWEHLI